MTSRKSSRRNSVLPYSQTLSFFPDTSLNGIGGLKTGLERRGSAPLISHEEAMGDQPVVHPLRCTEPVKRSPKKRLPLSKTWSTRFSSLLPSLISPTGISRKPVAPHTADLGPPPPPPYRIHDPPPPNEIPAG